MREDLSDILEQSRTKGLLESRGELKLDSVRAAELLAERQSKEAGFFALLAVQAFISAGATSVEIEFGHWHVSITGRDLGEFPVALPELHHALVARTLAADGTPAHYLAASLLCIQGVKPCRAELTLSLQHQKWMLSRTDPPQAASLRLKPRARSDQPFWRLLVRIPRADKRAIQTSLSNRLCYAPVAIRIDGRELHQGPLESPFWVGVTTALPDFIDSQGLRVTSLDGYRPSPPSESSQANWGALLSSPVLLRKVLPLTSCRAHGVAAFEDPRTLQRNASESEALYHVHTSHDLPRLPFHRQKQTHHRLPVARAILEICREMEGHCLIFPIKHGVLLDRLVVRLSLPGVVVALDCHDAPTDLSLMSLRDGSELRAVLDQVEKDLRDCLPELKAAVELMTPDPPAAPAWSNWGAVGSALIGGLAGGALMAPVAGYLAFRALRRVSRALRPSPESPREHERAEAFRAPYRQIVGQWEKTLAAPLVPPEGEPTPLSGQTEQTS